MAMTMPDDDILAPRKSRSGTQSRADFSGSAARGPIASNSAKATRSAL
jgi:hypothetical protein